MSQTWINLPSEIKKIGERYELQEVTADEQENFKIWSNMFKILNLYVEKC